MLRADPSRYSDAARALLNQLEAFLVNDLRLSVMPNVTLLNQPLGPPNEWQLYHIADVVVASEISCGFRPVLADNLGCIVWQKIGAEMKRAA